MGVICETCGSHVTVEWKPDHVKIKCPKCGTTAIGSETGPYPPSKGRWLHSNLHTELEVCECGCENPCPGDVPGKCRNCGHDIILLEG